MQGKTEGKQGRGRLGLVRTGLIASGLAGLVATGCGNIATNRAIALGLGVHAAEEVISNKLNPNETNVNVGTNRNIWYRVENLDTGQVKAHYGQDSYVKPTHRTPFPKRGYWVIEVINGERNKDFYLKYKDGKIY